MSKQVTVKALEARKADLMRQVRELDTAIKVARAKETERKSRAITAALQARGLLDGDLDTVLAAIAKAAPTSAPQAPAVTAQSAPIASTATTY